MQVLIGQDHYIDQLAGRRGWGATLIGGLMAGVRVTRNSGSLVGRGWAVGGIGTRAVIVDGAAGGGGASGGSGGGSGGGASGGGGAPPAVAGAAVVVAAEPAASNSPSPPVP